MSGPALPPPLAGRWLRALRWVGLAAAVLVLLAAGWLAWVKVPSRPSAALQASLQAAAARPCSQLQVIGVRGHSDPPEVVGPDVAALVTRLKARLGPGSADVLSLPYEQGPELGIVPLWVPRDIAGGADALDTYVALRAPACGTEHRVVVAESEGAALAHLAAARIANGVDAIVLLGDPLHLSSGTYDEDMGPAPNGALVPWMGMGLGLHRGGWADPVTAVAAPRVRSYCLPHDYVCGMTLLDRHPNTHTTYRYNPVAPGSGLGVLDRAVDFIVSRVGESSH
jgi:Cutinase